jgi:hypothetical protein
MPAEPIRIFKATMMPTIRADHDNHAAVVEFLRGAHPLINPGSVECTIRVRNPATSAGVDVPAQCSVSEKIRPQ